MKNWLNRPKHPFPYLLKEKEMTSFKFTHALSKKEKQILEEIKSGARIVFDIKQKRGIICRFKNTIEYLWECTVRLISLFVKMGYLIISEKRHHWIHYQWSGKN